MVSRRRTEFEAVNYGTQWPDKNLHDYCPSFSIPLIGLKKPFIRLRLGFIRAKGPDPVCPGPCWCV